MMTLIFLLALALRLYGLASSPLWYDEAISLYRTTQPLTFNLWEIVLRFFTWGPVWLLRLPALACALASIYMTWQLMDTLHYSNTQRIVTTSLLATLPGLLWMSQDARYYAPLAMLYVGSSLSALRRRVGWLTFCTVVSFYIHPTGPAYTLPAVLIALIVKRINWKQIAMLASLSAALWSIKFIFSALGDANFWAGPLTMQKFIYEYGQSISVNTLGAWGTLAAAVFGVLILCAGIYLISSPDDLIVWLAAVAPLAILLFISLTYKNVITYRTLQPLGMGLALLSGRVLSQRWTWVLTGMFVFAMLVNYDPSIRGGHLDRIAETINTNAKPGDCIQYENELAYVPLRLLVSLPECDHNPRWTVTSLFKDDVIAQTNGWHFPTLYLYENTRRIEQ